MIINNIYLFTKILKKEHICFTGIINNITDTLVYISVVNTSSYARLFKRNSIKVMKLTTLNDTWQYTNLGIYDINNNYEEFII